MKPTALLTEEHKAIKRMLRVAEGVSERLERGELLPPEHLVEITDFIRGFADKCHHAKEEGLLFPAMEKSGIPREGGPIGVMFHEHKLGRDFVRGMREAAEKYGSGDTKAASGFAENARGYADLLRQHIDKEDHILYRMADARLSPDAQQELEQGFEKVEEEEVGSGEHERYHRILEALEGIYLK
jgi:hemerythrin-like domain-containing protein